MIISTWLNSIILTRWFFELGTDLQNVLQIRLNGFQDEWSQYSISVMCFLRFNRLYYQNNKVIKISQHSKFVLYETFIMKIRNTRCSRATSFYLPSWNSSFEPFLNARSFFDPKKIVKKNFRPELKFHVRVFSVFTGSK